MEDRSIDSVENHVMVKYNDEKSILVKITPSTTVSQVLKKVCDKWNLNPDKHSLKYYIGELLEDDSYIENFVPHNSTLTVTVSLFKSNNINPEDIIPVSLQVQDKVIKRNFHKSETLSQVVTKLYEAGSITSSENKSILNQIRNELKQSVMEGNNKLLVKLPHGTLALELNKIEHTTLTDLSHDGHVFMTLLNKEQDDNLIEDNNEEIVTTDNYIVSDNKNEEEINEEEEDSQPSLTKIKNRIDDNESSTIIPSLSKQQNISKFINETQLLDRYGCIYRLIERKKSNTNIPKIKYQDEFGVYSLCWISIIFPDELVLQAAFSPSEYVYDIKEYIKQYLIHPTKLFELYHNDRILDNDEVLFTSGFSQKTELKFLSISVEDDISDSSNNTDNTIDKQYYKYIVSQEVANIIRRKYKKKNPEITIESECYRPKLEEHPQDKLTSKLN